MFKQNVAYGPGTETLSVHTFEILIMLLGCFHPRFVVGLAVWNKYKQQVNGLEMELNSLKIAQNTWKSEAELLKSKINTLEIEKNTLKTEVAGLTIANSDIQDLLNQTQLNLEMVQFKNSELDKELGIAMAQSPESKAVPMEAISSPIDLHVEDLAASEPEPEMESTLELAPLEETVPPQTKIPTTVHPEMDVPSQPISITAEEVISEITFADPTLEPDVELAVEPPVEINPIEVTPIIDPAVVVTETPVLASKPDDLKIVEGIGPKIEEILCENGIDSYKKMAATPVNRIKEILLNAGSRFAVHDPGTWPAQALLAANGEWENLKAYQSFLNAGKRPS